MKTTPPPDWKAEMERADARISAAQSDKDLRTKAERWDGFVKMLGVILISLVGLISTSIYQRLGSVFPELEKLDRDQAFAQRERQELHEALAKMEAKLDALGALPTKVSSLEAQYARLSDEVSKVRGEQMEARERFVELKAAVSNPPAKK
jgi:chromosome segregation ATPase